MNSQFNKWFAMSLATFIAIAASMPVEAKAFKWDDIRRIKIGMTAEQVKKIVGKPTTIVSTNGVTQYSWVKVTLTGKASIAWIQLENGIVTVIPDVPPEFK